MGGFMSTTRNVITFHYTLRDPDDRVIDTSSGAEPIVCLEGAGMIIEGLEEALAGVAAGTKTRIEVPTAKAYGEPDPEQRQKLPRSAIPVEGEIKVGDQFQTGTDRGAPVVRVVALEGDEVLLDANHALAGVDLIFDVEVVAVRPATPEEIAQGQPLAP